MDNENKNKKVVKEVVDSDFCSIDEDTRRRDLISLQNIQTETTAVERQTPLKNNERQLSEGQEQSNVETSHNQENTQSSQQDKKGIDEGTAFAILFFVAILFLGLGVLLGSKAQSSDSKSEKQSSDSEKSYKINLTLDMSTAHSKVFVSDNNRIVSNYYSSDTPNVVYKYSYRKFENYEGVLGDTCFTQQDKIYFEVMFSFHLRSKFVDEDLVAEIGLADHDNVDEDSYVGSSKVKGWSFHISYCELSICLFAQHYRQNIENIKNVSQTNVAGIRVNGTFGFFVNLDRKEFSIIDKETWKILYTFKEIWYSSRSKLCPVFGVYNAQSLDVRLMITNSYDLTNTPVIMVIA